MYTSAANANGDDGDRNFNKGLVSNRLDLFTEMDAVWQQRAGLRMSGAAYYVQYSTDLTTWFTAQPAVAGNNNWIEWLDIGPPKSKSLPADDPTGRRFYRVLRIP